MMCKFLKMVSLGIGVVVLTVASANAIELTPPTDPPSQKEMIEPEHSAVYYDDDADVASSAPASSVAKQVVKQSVVSSSANVQNGERIYYVRSMTSNNPEYKTRFSILHETPSPKRVAGERLYNLSEEMFRIAVRGNNIRVLDNPVFKLTGINSATGRYGELRLNDGGTLRIHDISNRFRGRWDIDGTGEKQENVTPTNLLSGTLPATLTTYNKDGTKRTHEEYVMTFKAMAMGPYNGYWSNGNDIGLWLWGMSSKKTTSGEFTYVGLDLGIATIPVPQAAIVPPAQPVVQPAAPMTMIPAQSVPVAAGAVPAPFVGGTSFGGGGGFVGIPFPIGGGGGGGTIIVQVPYCKQFPNDASCRPICQRYPNDPSCKPICERFPNDPSCKPYCERVPNDPSCKPICERFPNDPSCKPICERFPNDPSCKPFCERFPNDASCKPVCERFPNDPSCKPFCERFPNDASCKPICERFPNDPSCKPICERFPNDPSCKPICERFPNDPSCKPICERFPNDPSCKPICEREPNNPVCVLDCTKTPNHPSCKPLCEREPNNPVCVVDCTKTPNHPSCKPPTNVSEPMGVIVLMTGVVGWFITRRYKLRK